LSSNTVGDALQKYQHEIDTPTLNNILINFQLERLLWLRARETEHNTPNPSIDSTVRTVDALLKRRERIEHKQAPADATDDEEKPWLMTDEEFRRMVEIYAEETYGPRDPDENPEQAAVRTSMRHSLGLPDEPDEDEKRRFPRAHNIPEPAPSSEPGALTVPSNTAIQGGPIATTTDAAPTTAPTAPALNEAPAPAAEGETIAADAQSQSASHMGPEPQEWVPMELPPNLPYWFNDPTVDYMQKRRWLKGHHPANFDFGSALARVSRRRSTFDSS
jgi:hypothetical protein